MSDEPHDPLPDMIASVDQALADAPHLVRMYRGYFAHFVGMGFLPSQALYLTAAQMIQHPGTAP